jgi:Virus neck protein
MSTNFYFNNFPTRLADAPVTSEQLLVENLVIEALQIYGLDVYYLPRTTRDQVDYLFGEDVLKEYRTAQPIEMYLENVTGFDGEQDFISKFGLEIRDEVTMLVSRLRFRYTVNGYTRPREGDLVYVPMTTSFFEITSVESENDQAMFYTLGRGRGGNVYVYALRMKQFYFSNEIIETGVKEIDGSIRNYYSKLRISLGSGSGKFVNDEIVYQGANLSSATAQALVYDFEPNAYVDVYRMQGDFTSSANVKGSTSSAQWTVTLASDAAVQNTAFEDIIDNARIEAASDGIIDFTEVNPFGEP